MWEMLFSPFLINVDIDNAAISFFLEEVMPLEQYVVSVTALYGELGASRKETVCVYTRQGGTWPPCLLSQL